MHDDHRHFWEQHNEHLHIVSMHQLATAATMCADANRMAEKAGEMMSRAAAVLAIVARQRAVPKAV